MPADDAGFRIVAAGDAALVVEFADRIDRLVNARVVALAEAIQSADIAGVRDIVPTIRSLAVYFDPLRADGVGLMARLEREAGAAGAVVEPAREPVRIPVCYGGEFGPDLAELAAWAGMTEEDAIATHVREVYQVFMLGFVPGFAYLGTVDARIAAPRRSTPRLRVPAGSVGIAGVQTGIYPAETPGGWQLIGRTPLRMFDPGAAEPFRLKPGDHVRFHRIEASEFAAVRADAGGGVAA